MGARSFVSLLTVFLGVMLGTPAFAQKVTDHDEIIVNGDLRVFKNQDWPEGWRRRGEAEHAKVIPYKPGGDRSQRGVFEFSQKNAGAQQVVVLDSSWESLELSFSMKVDSVVRGSADWQDARMALRFVDKQWNVVKPWPKSTGRVGSSEWRDFTVAIKVSEGAHALVIEPSMLGESGTVWFSDITLKVTALKSPGSGAASGAANSSRR